MIGESGGCTLTIEGLHHNSLFGAPYGCANRCVLHFLFWMKERVTSIIYDYKICIKLKNVGLQKRGHIC